MPTDPLDPGAMPRAEVALTNAQIQQMIAVVETHKGSIRLEKLHDAYARVVLIGPDGDALSEHPLFPA